jgi:hypothetical protein
MTKNLLAVIDHWEMRSFGEPRRNASASGWLDGEVLRAAIFLRSADL